MDAYVCRWMEIWGDRSPSAAFNGMTAISFKSFGVGTGKKKKEKKNRAIMIVPAGRDGKRAGGEQREMELCLFI